MTLEVVRYGTAKFWIEEGMYSIEQVEQMLRTLKEAKRIQDEHLAQAIKREEGIIAQFLNKTFDEEEKK